MGKDSQGIRGYDNLISEFCQAATLYYLEISSPLRNTVSSEPEVAEICMVTVDAGCDRKAEQMNAEWLRIHAQEL